MVNSDSPGTVQNEVRIAVDPVNSLNIVTAYNDSIGAASTPLGISFSIDGGLNWMDRQLSTPLNPQGVGNFVDIFDPIISASAGDFYAGYIGTNGRPSVAGGGDSGLFIERSSDGGNTWTGATVIDSNPASAGPVDGNYRFNDRPHMFTDLAGFTHVTWIKDVGVNLPTSDIYYNYSNLPAVPNPPINPTGLSFLPTSVLVNDNSAGSGGNDMGNVPYVASHPNGRVYVAWIDVNVQNPNASSATIKLDSATVPGAPVFGTDISVITIDPIPRRLSDASLAPEAKADSYPVIGVDPNDVTAQTIYMAYAAEPGGGDESDIFFIKSTNGGASWSTPLRVNDDATTNDQMQPAIALKQGPGGTVIDLIWYDKRNGAGDNMWDVYAARSSNGGASFSSNVRLSDTSSLMTTDTLGNGWLGEYLGLAIDPVTQDALTVFTARGSLPSDQYGDIYFDRTANSAIPEPPSMVLALLAFAGVLSWRRFVR